MPTIHTTSEDLAKMRFAYRPLIEIPLSYRVLINPEYQSPHLRWVEEAKRALYDVELPFMKALLTDSGYIPDFLTPTPLTNGVNVEDDIEALKATPDDLIRMNVRNLLEDAEKTEARLFFISHPREAIHALVEELKLYWRRALESSWSRMIGVLEGDILYRGRLLALDGAGPLLEDLHPTILYQPHQIQVTHGCNHAHCPHEVSLHGSGIQLVPTIFTGVGRMIQITPEWHPMVIYSARGAGLYNRVTRASNSLELAIGAGRARILQALKTPASTGELAHRLSVSSGAVSQVLSRLTKADLVEAHRSGKRVYYRLTQRGAELIALFERIY